MFISFSSVKKTIFFAFFFIKYLAPLSLSSELSSENQYIAYQLSEDKRLETFTARVNSNLKSALKTKNGKEFHKYIQNEFTIYKSNFLTSLKSFHFKNISNFSISGEQCYFLLKYFWIKILSMDNEKDASLLESILLDDEIHDPIEKIRTLYYFGIFMHNPDNVFDHCSKLDSNFSKALYTLKSIPETKLYLRVEFLDTLMEKNFVFHPLWSEEEIENQKEHILKKINKNKLNILETFLYSSDIHSALKYLDYLAYLNIKLLGKTHEIGTNILLQCHCQILEFILDKMHKSRHFIDHGEDTLLTDINENNSLLDDVIIKFLDDNVFSLESLSIIKEAKKNYKNTLSDTQWGAVASYIAYGIIKKKISSQLLNSEIPEMLEDKHLSKIEFKEFIHYINGKNTLFKEYRKYHELDDLFGINGKNNENIFYQLALRRDYNNLSQIFFILKGQPINQNWYGTNYFHLIINKENSNLKVESLDDEEEILKIINLFLYSPYINDKNIISALKSTDFLGFTPLLLAASKGLENVYEKLKKYLMQLDSFNREDHVLETSIEAILIKGCLKRYFSLNAPYYHKKLLNLNKRLKDIKIIKPYDPRNPEHIETINQISKNVKEILAKQISYRLDPVKHIYQAAFNEVYSFFYTKNVINKFHTAPLSIRLSYLEEPLKLIITKICEDHPSDFLDEKRIFRYMSKDWASKIGRSEEQALLKLISRELANFYIVNRPEGIDP